MSIKVKSNFFDIYSIRATAIMLFVYHSCVFLYLFQGLREVFFLPLLCILYSLMIFFTVKKLQPTCVKIFYIIQLIHFVLLMAATYSIVGIINVEIAHFILMDPFAIKIDQYFLGGESASHVTQAIFGNFGLASTIFYDFFMISYISYFIWPFLPILLFFLKRKSLKREEECLRIDQDFGNYMFSMFALNILIFALYLLVPITGPQYYLAGSYEDVLPFSILGKIFHEFIRGAQNNFIDCFPSGHVGTTLLSLLWYFKMDFSIKRIVAIFFFGITCATIFIRYHYLIDILVAVFLAVIIFFLTPRLHALIRKV